MKLTKQFEEGLNATYIISGVTPAYVNALRRYSMDYVPTLAIEDIDIVLNDSGLYDEVVAHRLGLIPLTTDLDNYTLPEGEDISAMNSVQLTLNVECSDESGYVYAKDLQTKDPKVKPVYGDVQVTYLLEDQKVELTATAVMGQGKDHQKWSPANVYYSYEPKVSVNNKSAKLKECIDKFPPQVVKDGKIDAAAIATPALLDACDGICDDVVSVTYDNTSFVFTVESFGQLDVVALLGEASVQFNKQLDEVKDLVKVLKN